MLITLEKATAERIIALHNATAKGKDRGSRPLLAGICFRWNDVKDGRLPLEVAATDSYKAARRTFVLSADLVEFEDTDVKLKRPDKAEYRYEATVESKALSDAVKAAWKGHVGRICLLFNGEAGTVTVTNEAVSVASTMSLTEGQFPRMDAIFEGGYGDVDDVTYRGPASALNPEYLNDLVKSTGVKDKPVRLVPPPVIEGKDQALRPWAVRIAELDYGVYEGLIMTVRI